MVGVNRGMPSGTQCDELMSVNKIILISRLETDDVFVLLSSNIDGCACALVSSSDSVCR